MEPTSPSANQLSGTVISQTDSITNPKDSVKDILASFLSITIFYWIVYLFFNWAFRIGDGSGISILPQQGSNSQQFLLAPIGALLSLGLVSLARKLMHSGKKSLAIISLLSPVMLAIFAFVWAIIFPCEGELCGLGAGILIMVVLVLAAGVYICLLITTVSIFFIRKYKYGLVTLIILFFLLLLTPIIYSFLVEASFKSKISEKISQVSRVSLQKVEISKEEYDGISKLEPCCRVLETKQTGVVVLTKLSQDELLLQGPVASSKDPYGQTIYKASLLVENDNKIIDIGKGANFSAFSILPRAGSGSRPIFLSIPKRMVAFFQEYVDAGDFIISKLDGTGIYIDSNFCSWDCTVAWSRDGFIYLSDPHQNGPEYNYKYYKVTPP
ncbi:MAG: hypothetical protein AAB521_02290 [Patescibacteria group bacterium]